MPYVGGRKLAGSPSRIVNVIRVMLSEPFRINSHLLYISTFWSVTLGAMTPVFAFTDRQKFMTRGSYYRFPYAPGSVFRIICRARLAARLGSPAARVPEDAEASDFTSALRNTILKAAFGVAAYGAKEALEWGTTTGLRAHRPTSTCVNGVHTSGYENFDLKCAGGRRCFRPLYPRDVEKWKSWYRVCAFFQQCLDKYAGRPVQADSPTTPPPKERTLQTYRARITTSRRSPGPGDAGRSSRWWKRRRGQAVRPATAAPYFAVPRAHAELAHLQQIPSAIRGSPFPT